MNLIFLNSASVIIEDRGVKILCDPWLVDGEFYGSWAHYPPCSFVPEDFDDVDFIYVSHIHPDHFSTKTLERMDKKIPILIHSYHFKYLRENIQRLGFKPVEIPHNIRTHLKDDLHINILAADNCDPQLCLKYFGCGLAEKTFGSTSIDSMCVIDNGKEVIVNTNDCPFPLGQTSATTIKNTYGNIDMLLAGYSSATAYPQCFDLSNDQKEMEKQLIIKKFFTQAEAYVNLLKPKFFIPFAGRYVLSGKNWELNNQRAVPELEEAYDYFASSKNIDQSSTKCIILNSMGSFDISTGKASDSYKRVNQEEKSRYLRDVLAKVKYDFEGEKEPESGELTSLVQKCYQRFENKRKELGFSSDTTILLDFDDDVLAISANGNGYKFESKKEITKYTKFVQISVDKKLFKWLLLGPKFAHWNNAEIGSHLRYKRNPNIYERGLFYCLNFFHV